MTHSASLAALKGGPLLESGSTPTILNATSGEALHIPGGNFLLTADFHRAGSDLVLTGKDGHEVVVRDYFASHNPPDLISGTGGVIHADLAERLAGAIAPGQWAQEGAPAPQLHAIGEIQKMSGTVKVHHIDGHDEILKQGATVFQGDVLETTGDGSVGIVFADRSTFSLGKNGRMVMDEMVYDPQSHTGHSSMSVVQGTFSFVSGQIAKSGPDAMSVKTPVMTIGIRGTTVGGYAAAEGSQNTVALLNDDDGGVGQIVVATQNGQPMVLTQANMALQLSSAFQAPPAPVVLPPQALQQLIPELSAVQASRPSQPTSDPHINTNPSGSANPTGSQQGTSNEKTGSASETGGTASGAATNGKGDSNTASSSSPDSLLVATPTIAVPVTPVVAPVVPVVPVVVPVVTPITTTTTTTAAQTTTVTPVVHTNTTTTTTTLTSSDQTLVGTGTGITLTGGTGTNTFIGHGGNDEYILGTHTNILVLNSSHHAETVVESSLSGAHNIVNASALNGGFAGATNSDGDLVVYFDGAAGGGSLTLQHYYSTDNNLLTVVGSNSTDVMTFLKDTSGSVLNVEVTAGSYDGDVWNGSTAQLNEIVGTTGADIIVAASDNLIVLGSSNVLAGGTGGKDVFILEGMGDVVVGGDDRHNTAYFNHLSNNEDANGLFFDFTSDNDHSVILSGTQLSANIVTNGSQTTYLVNIESVWGSNHGDTFVGGKYVDGVVTSSQDFHAGTGANVIVDDSSVHGRSNYEQVTAIYESSGAGITADMSAGDASHDPYASGDTTVWISPDQNTYDTIPLYGIVSHDGVTDKLYGVDQVEGSAYNDTMIGSIYGDYFVSSLGNDTYYGNGEDGTKSDAVEVSYEDSGSQVVINLSGTNETVTAVLSSGTTITATLETGTALHDLTSSGGATDHLICVEEFRMPVDYGAKVFGDGTVTLDYSSSDFAGITIDLSAGKAYGWESGVTDSFQNIGSILDESGTATFVVSSESLQDSTIWGNGSAATLDLTALGPGVQLIDSHTNGVYEGTAILSNGSSLVFGGITDIETSSLVAITNGSLDLSGFTGNVEVVLATSQVMTDSATYDLSGTLPSASAGHTLDLILGNNTTAVLQGTQDQMSGITQVTEGSGDYLTAMVSGSSIHLSGATALLKAQALVAEQTATVNLDAAWQGAQTGVTALFVDFVGTSNNLLEGSYSLFTSNLMVQLEDDTGSSIILGNGAHNTVILDIGNSEHLQGGSGNDQFFVLQGSHVTIDGGAGTDSLLFSGLVDANNADLTNLSLTATLSQTVAAGGTIANANGVETVFSNIEDITGSAHDDRFVLNSHSGGHTLDGGGGTDILDYSANASGVTVDLYHGTATGDGSSVDHIYNFEVVEGSSGNDLLIGGTSALTLYGNSGHNILIASSGDATLFGGDQLDTLYAGSGTDILFAGTGDATFIGGSGQDTEYLGLGGDSTVYGGSDSTVDYANAIGSVTVNLDAGTVTGSSWSDSLSFVSQIVGSAGDDTFIAGDGTFGEDKLNIGTDADWSYSGTGALTLSNSSHNGVEHETFAYNNDGFGNSYGYQHFTWTVTATASMNGEEVLNWEYAGNHDGFQASASLWYEVSGDTTSHELVSSTADGNYSNISWTNFDWLGSLTLDLLAGETVSFFIQGYNFDSGNVMHGSLDLWSSYASLNGGGGTDVLELTNTMLLDNYFAQASDFSALKVDNAESITLASHFDATGIGTIDLSNDGNFSAMDASGTTSDLYITLTSDEFNDGSLAGGTGVTELKLSGGNANLSVSDSHMTNLDAVSMGANSTLYLAQGDVAADTKTTNAITGQGNALLVIGGATDTVNLYDGISGHWSNTGTGSATVNNVSHSYQVYTNSATGEHVDVESAVHVNVVNTA